MPKRSSGSLSEKAISDMVQQFVDQLVVAIEGNALSRARERVLSAFGGGAPAGGMPATAAAPRLNGRPRGPGRPPGRPRKKPPIQLCPVPGCNNRAAPVFGMVCSKHKDLPKAEIKKYREQRRADKEKGKAKGRKAA